MKLKANAKNSNTFFYKKETGNEELSTHFPFPNNELIRNEKNEIIGVISRELPTFKRFSPMKIEPEVDPCFNVLM
ncbi:hypothetical protein [Legionella brunensis]|uniref:Uncharacterized protein n=1 Tax=Legionella brunensis TaxID=29422 RepID=A0A0W0SNJ4_9GAMM|nr:hypothetical protein [Legionella brunensis]KTC84950.1 hypothetical protein Lbru_1165 [Legionella brunensis]